MEMIRGGSLADRLEREGPLPPADVIELGITLAEALEHAHQGGVLHLDLKPENILMSRFGRPKIVDFGIAALVHEESSTSAIRATPSYADPDVLDGHHGTARSDVYGLAATLFTLLSGSPPYSNGPSGLYQVMRRVALDPVPTVERDDVPRGLATVLHRAMAKDPNERPASMQEFAAELRGIGTEPVTEQRAHREPAPDERRDHEPAMPRDPNRGLPITPPPRPGGSDAPSNPTPRPVVAPPPAPVVSAAPAWGSGEHPHVQSPPSPQPYQNDRQPPLGQASGGAPTPWSGTPVLQGTIARPRTALIPALSGVAAILAILIVVVIVVQQQDNASTATVPVGTAAGTAANGDVDVTIAAVADGQVPNVVGASTAAARTALEALDYVVVTDPHCFDVVAGQAPPGGTALDDGGRVELVFDPCVVPDFVGLDLDSAKSIVEDEFVTGLLISWPAHCDDVILGQSIAPGVTVEPGTKVELTLRTDCG